ncbi:MAG: hypothetical protein O3A00_22305 [Planctomycetota bacterium]|nr:hypothetical protein [Planctomycetota bacterium]
MILNGSRSDRRPSRREDEQLEKQYHDSTLPAGPDEPGIRDLLLICLKEHYGRFEDCAVNVDDA